MKYQIAATVFIQEIDEDVILLDTESQEYFSLNGVGKIILDLISENLTHEEIIEEFLLILPDLTRWKLDPGELI